MCVCVGLCVCHSRNSVNHVQPHLHTAVGVVCLGLGQSRHTVVTVSKNFDPPAVILLQTQRDGYLKQLPAAIYRVDSVSHTFFTVTIKIHLFLVTISLVVSLEMAKIAQSTD